MVIVNTHLICTSEERNANFPQRKLVATGQTPVRFRDLRSRYFKKDILLLKSMTTPLLVRSIYLKIFWNILENAPEKRVN